MSCSTHNIWVITLKLIRFNSFMRRLLARDNNFYLLSSPLLSIQLWFFVAFHSPHCQSQLLFHPGLSTVFQSFFQKTENPIFVVAEADAAFVCLFSYHCSVVCFPSPAADLSHFSIPWLFEPKQGTKQLLINIHKIIKEYHSSQQTGHQGVDMLRPCF